VGSEGCRTEDDGADTSTNDPEDEDEDTADPEEEERDEAAPLPHTSIGDVSLVSGRLAFRIDGVGDALFFGTEGPNADAKDTLSLAGVIALFLPRSFWLAASAAIGTSGAGMGACFCGGGSGSLRFDGGACDEAAPVAEGFAATLLLS